MAAINTQFSIAVHVLAALAHYERSFTSEILAGSVNANPVFVKRILVKLSKAKLVKAAVGKSGGYDLAKSPKKITLLDIYSVVNAPAAIAVHTYPDSKGCIVSCNINSVMGGILNGTQRALENDLEKTTLQEVVSKIRGKKS